MDENAADASNNLDRTRVDDSLVIIEALSDCIFSNNSLSSTGVSRYQDTFVSLNSMNGNFLKGIQREFVFSSRLRWRNMIGNRNIVIAWRYRDLMANLRENKEFLDENPW
jgi:hypothetical protein